MTFQFVTLAYAVFDAPDRWSGGKHIGEVYRIEGDRWDAHGPTTTEGDFPTRGEAAQWLKEQADSE